MIIREGYYVGIKERKFLRRSNNWLTQALMKYLLRAGSFSNSISAPSDGLTSTLSSTGWQPFVQLDVLAADARAQALEHVDSLRVDDDEYL